MQRGKLSVYVCVKKNRRERLQRETTNRVEIWGFDEIGLVWVGCAKRQYAGEDGLDSFYTCKRAGETVEDAGWE